jgi:flavin reductase (DIM6/NTAB) family NADH-FMN oxidoreductase RutF
MKTFDLSQLGLQATHALLLAGIAPRPIALVSTQSSSGHNNLAPFSFFNAFGANPAMVAFSPSRRGKDGSLKDTYVNLMATRECVIQAVTFDMVHAVNETSKEFPPEVDEFKESGLTPLDSIQVKPKRVAESPFQMECRLHQMVHLGNGLGSGNLAICEVLLIHVSETVMTEGEVDPRKLDLVARNGGTFYTRSWGDALFSLARPR